MLKRMEVFLILSVFILIVAIILIVYSKQRENEFKANNIITQKAIVNGASYAINLQLLEKHRHVSLFANEYAANLIQLNNNPDDETLASELKKRLEQRFTDFFTFTITDDTGIPKLLNIESLIGHACQLDLNNFAKHMNSNKQALQNEIFIHPQPFNYHYDIMAPLRINQLKPSIFFVSFYLDEIAKTLKTHEIPGQKLIIVRRSNKSLIEVSSKGSRDKLKRSMNLSNDELSQINAYKDIERSDWRLVIISDANYEKEYVKGLWKEAIIIILLVSFALLVLTSILIKISGKKEE